jgi:hypothetical protein
MELKPGTKIPLNKITNAVRASQAVLQYGVGAMIDFPDQTLMTAAPEYWAQKTERINDERLEKLLHVDYFGMPGGRDEPKYSEGISYSRFPEWYFCPKCRKFQPLNKWIDEYRRNSNLKVVERDQYMIKHVRCPVCRQDLVVARIVTVCKNGHIDDFPWIKWVHRRNLGGMKEVCSNPSLTFKTGASSTEGLEGLVITCKNCNSKATLRGAFDPDVFKKMDEKSNKVDFMCRGRHPWKNIFEKCTEYPRAIQRGSSSVYFPISVSSLVIPPFSNIINTKVEGSESFKGFRTTLLNLPQELRQLLIKTKIDSWSLEIALEIGVKKSIIRSILDRKWNDVSSEEYSTLSVKYRAEEYEALNGGVDIPIEDAGDFVREYLDAEKYNIPYVKKVSLIHKIREVQALIGFSRLQPLELSAQVQDMEGFVSIKLPDTRWYPGYEVRGEGIFIEFNQEAIKRWIVSSEELEDRVRLVNENYKNSFIGQNGTRIVTAKFLLLHTMSHLLIKQLSFECGYSIASLKERIYCSDEKDGKEMAGILIYTASGDSEGTLGGLVRQGLPDCLGNIFTKALKSAMTCSNDPVCILSKGQGRDSLNLAACYACTLIPETSCEEFNVFLDRATVVGTFENRKLGFYDNESIVTNSWEYDETVTKCIIKKDIIEEDVHEIVHFNKSGLNCRDMKYREIWEYIIEDGMSENEEEVLEELIKRSSDLEGCEKPFYGEMVQLIGSNKTILVDLVWMKAKVFLFVSDNQENYDFAKKVGLKCYITNDKKINSEQLIKAIKGMK